MAELRRCLSSGADRVPLRMSHRRLSGSHVPRGRGAARAAVLPVGSGLNVSRSGADGAAAGGASPDGYTRLPPPPRSCGHIRERPSCPGPGQERPPGRTWVEAAQRHVLQPGSGAHGWGASPGPRPTPGGSLPGGRLLCVRLYGGDGGRSEPLHRTRTGYYEILEVPPAATQAQIKTAYYKQSFIHHPDRNSGSEATVRFSEISEAYAVLGNKGLRRKYDLGLLTPSDLTSTRRPSGKEGPGPQPGRRAAVSAEQRGKIYDFDSFFKSHYSEQLQRQKDIRVRREELQRRKEQRLHETSMDKVMEVSLVVLLMLAVGLLVSIRKQ